MISQKIHGAFCMHHEFITWDGRLSFYECILILFIANELLIAIYGEELLSSEIMFIYWMTMSNQDELYDK